VWTDPDFDPAQPAFYYVRVIEIPTPRWVVYDRARLGAKLPEDAELIHQERAYTSPIWYTPARQRSDASTRPSHAWRESTDTAPAPAERAAQ